MSLRSLDADNRPVVPGADSQWHPILEGAWHEEAQRAVQDIAVALASVFPPDSSPDPDPNLATLARGLPGPALFFAYQAEAQGQGRDLALAHLNAAIDQLAAVALPPALFSGYTGPGWISVHLQERLFREVDEELTADLDAALLADLEHPPSPPPIDLLTGLVGYGIYALERREKPLPRRCLELIVAGIETQSESHANGITWYTPPESLPPQERGLFPRGYYNVGVAHGVPGVMAFLAQAWRAGIERERTARLLQGTISWLLHQKSAAPRESAFPYHMQPGVEPGTSRLGWCYGDPGVAATLLLAARCAGEPAWEREALTIGRAAARRSLASGSVFDAGLCHGAAGLGHLFNRMYQATGDPLLLESARRWFREALAMRRPEFPLGGFAAMIPRGETEREPANEPGFLIGAAGIGLALLAAISPVEPEWDRVLLLSTRSG